MRTSPLPSRLAGDVMEHWDQLLEEYDEVVRIPDVQWLERIL